MSPHSKTLMGREWSLFSLIVFKIPGTRVVLTTWYSMVLGLANFTALESSRLFRNLKFSSCEHNVNGITSSHPLCAEAILRMSAILLIGNGWATVAAVLGVDLLRLSYP
ncbi:hypothetical protein OGAPHI_003386 [Ogataea philodendri]|uniref:Uncharacterized protein n=1 Tax=Ogataea philodendri TaxID=1378263 RepID=A0A9P8T6G1_9ASCO|nr:uncharacterized protein OGAPHI_003386 [Ogataea philodendri]KAH3666936.1 hypothetical protein OGAPHI_003386 [Ogataea philodendri]